jgi:hypothetical protein
LFFSLYFSSSLCGIIRKQVPAEFDNPQTTLHLPKRFLNDEMASMDNGDSCHLAVACIKRAVASATYPRVCYKKGSGEI